MIKKHSILIERGIKLLQQRCNELYSGPLYLHMKRHCLKFNNEVRKFRSLGDLKTARWFQAMRLLVQSNTKTSHWRNCWMDDDDLDELYEDVVDSSHGWHLWKFGKLPDTINSCKGISYKDEHPIDKFIRGWYQNVNGQGRVIYIYIYSGHSGDVTCKC